MRVSARQPSDVRSCSPEGCLRSRGNNERGSCSAVISCSSVSCLRGRGNSELCTVAATNTGGQRWCRNCRYWLTNRRGGVRHKACTPSPARRTPSLAPDPCALSLVLALAASVGEGIARTCGGSHGVALGAGGAPPSPARCTPSLAPSSCVCVAALS